MAGFSLRVELGKKYTAPVANNGLVPVNQSVEYCGGVVVPHMSHGHRFSQHRWGKAKAHGHTMLNEGIDIHFLEAVPHVKLGLAQRHGSLQTQSNM